MELKDIEQLLHTFDQSSATAFDWSESDFQIHLSKQAVSELPISPKPSSSVNEATDSLMTEEKNQTVEQSLVDDDSEESTTIASPMVGLVYLAPDPAQPPYKKVGDTVEAGDVLCVIEAMKMFTEVKSEVSGTITDILVSDGDMVEYDQPLIKVNERS
ncbi:MAG: acetyl-CoA carboxylase biotin carboxyl carrier protein [Aerococcus sp.]|nr:acetyl-CoA carboxylase biotin carboxyl carrier protein [Aerococcus sp.]